MSHVDSAESLSHGSEARMVSLIISICPLCLDRNVSLAHVGLHLTRIAIFALPRSTGMEEDDDDEANSAKAALKSCGTRDSDSVLESHDFWVPSEEPNGLEQQRTEAEQLGHLTGTTNLVSTFLNQERLAEAEKLEVQVMETRMRVLGAEHPDTLISLAHLASIYSGQGRLEEAEELEVQLMNTRKKVLGAEHPDTQACLIHLASTYQDQRQWKRAEEVVLQILDVSRKTFRADLTLQYMADLALIYAHQERLKEAEELAVEIMEICKRMPGQYALLCMADLAYAFYAQNHKDAAKRLMVDFVEYGQEIFRADHPRMLDSARTLSKWNNDSM